MIFAAHTMNQEKLGPSFSLKASDIVKEIGWDKVKNQNQINY